MRPAVSEDRTPTRALYAGLFLTSVAVLMQEILLTRIFSFTIWYHLAYLTISTALLGFGAAGSLLTLVPHWVSGRTRMLAGLCAIGAGVTLVLAMFVVADRPLRPDELLARPAGFALDLFGYYAVISLPFLLAGAAVATPLAAYPLHVNRLYATDLLGAGLGCVAAVASLTWLDGEASIAVCAGLFIVAGAFYLGGRRLSLGVAVLGVALLCAAPYASRAFEFRTTISKTLGSATREMGASILFTQWSPVNRVDVFSIPGFRGGFWTAWGRSRLYTSTPPRSLSIVYDGHNGSDVYEVKGRESLDVLDHHILSTPYLFQDRPRVLVIGVGGGIDLFAALYHGASSVTGAELQPITVSLLNGPLAGVTGGWFQRPEVRLVASEGRHYVRSVDEQYEVIQITAVDTFSAQTTGAYVLAESYLYTVEAFSDYLSKLGDDGMLSIIVGDHYYNDPAIASPFSTRLALVAREALARRGIADATPHILLTGQAIVNPEAAPDEIVHGAYIQNLIVKKTPFSPEQMKPLRAFASENDFTVRLAPDGSPGDPTIERIVRAPASELEEILAGEVFQLRPITDDRPFFFHVLRWGQLFIDDRIEWDNPGAVTGQIVLLMMLGQAILLGGALIALPLIRGARGALSRSETARFLLYFLGLGLGFLLIEISFVQKYVLLLGYPTYSLSVTIFSLLVFAALGAALSRRGWARPRRFLVALLVVTVALVALEVLVQPWITAALLGSPIAVRVAATALLQLPLGVVLGMYFPTGIEMLRRREPALIPWAWAVNGVGSVASAVLAVLLAMAIGFSGVALVAAVIYTIGTLSLLPLLRET